MNELRGCTGDPGGGRRRRVMSSETADFVVRRLFSAGLALGTCVGLLDREQGDRVTAVISELDEIGRDVRRATRLHDRGNADPVGDPQREALVAGMGRVLGELTNRIDFLGRADTAEVPSPHLLDAIQSMQRALAYLSDGADGAPRDEADPGVESPLRPGPALLAGRRTRPVHVANTQVANGRAVVNGYGLA